MDISNPSNWLGPYQYYKPNTNSFTLNETFTSQVLAFEISTLHPRPTWHTGGWINQIIEVNLETSADSWSTFYKKLKLGKTILTFPENYDSYKLIFSFPIWFNDGQLSVWEYKE